MGFRENKGTIVMQKKQLNNKSCSSVPIISDYCNIERTSIFPYEAIEIPLSSILKLAKLNKLENGNVRIKFDNDYYGGLIFVGVDLHA